MAGRVTQLVVESLNGGKSNVRASQMVVETAITAHGHVRVSQVSIETLMGAHAHVRASQIVLEVLIITATYPAPPAPLVYPQLDGQGYPIVMRPTWRTSEAIAAGSGRSKRVSFGSWPIWEWDLTYEYLPDVGSADFGTLVGFLLAQAGGAGYFAFRDATFNTCANQPEMVGDGTTRSFVLTYTAGLGEASIEEPIGFLNLDEPYNIYVNGTVLASNQFTISTGTPHNQVVTLATAPTSGQAVTASFEFYFAARFKDDVQDFEEFMQRLWSANKITLQSVLG
jgi:uncharacterized protein (TIGR02217 family)